VNPDPQDLLTAYQGNEAFAPEDAVYTGATFDEVRRAVIERTRYYDIWPGPGLVKFPNYPLRLRDLLRRFVWPRPYPFRQAAERTVDSRADLRWGPDGKGVRRLLHPNGLCLTGEWQITVAETGYTGYFAPGKRGLVIARYSVGGEPYRGRPRSLSLVGKVYPTLDRDDPRKFVPAAFITQEDFGGSGVANFYDAPLLNAPDTHAWRRGLTVFAMLAVTGLVFRRTDTNPTFRQLHEIAELEKLPDQPTRAPEFMRLLVEGGRAVAGDRLDFRDEVIAQMYEPAVRDPQRELVFRIETSDDGYTRGPLFYQRRFVSNWKPIGRIVFREATASYNGDFVIHFHHPAWRTDRNDPNTAARDTGGR
jgi:hypothetical protein